MNKDWELLKKDTIHEGWFRVYRYHFKHTLFAGGWTGEIDREVFQRGDVAAVLPYDPKLDRVVLVEQFRIGAMNDKESPWLVETIAGMIEPGEEPEEMVRREGKEEAGLTLGELIPVRKYYASPGGGTEEVHVYCALTDLSEAGGFHGLEAENEDIRVINCSADEALQMLEDGTIRNAISIIAMQWFAVNRDRLRD